MNHRVPHEQKVLDLVRETTTAPPNNHRTTPLLSLSNPDATALSFFNLGVPRAQNHRANQRTATPGFDLGSLTPNQVVANRFVAASITSDGDVRATMKIT
ncbi:hypothetical protein ACSQ67_022782 [Phaseolus vulgaris]